MVHWEKQNIMLLLPEKERRELPDDSPNIFIRSNIDLYLERASAIFCIGKFRILNDFCYAEFVAYYTLENKSNKACGYQPEELDDNLIEINHKEFSYPQTIKLMISGKTMPCRKVRGVLRHHVPNKFLSPKEFAHHLLLLFHQFRDKK